MPLGALRKRSAAICLADRFNDTLEKWIFKNLQDYTQDAAKLRATTRTSSPPAQHYAGYDVCTGTPLVYVNYDQQLTGCWWCPQCQKLWLPGYAPPAIRHHTGRGKACATPTQRLSKIMYRRVLESA